MVVSGNTTTHINTSSNEQIILISYNTFVLLSSFIGDTLILIGITRYNAIRLHKALVVVILHLAVSDLLLTTFEVLPQTISLVFQGWVLGDLLCVLNPNINIICITTTALLTSLFTSFKLVIVTYPLRSVTWSAMNVHVVCGVCWVVCFLQPGQIIRMFYSDTVSLQFSFLDYTCDYTQHIAPSWMLRASEVFTFGRITLALIVLITTSVLLLLKARKLALKRGKTLRWQGVVTVTMTTAVYLISSIPWAMVSLLSLVITLNVAAWRTALFISNLNIMANFYVYSLNVQSFRHFIKEGVLYFARCMINVGGMRRFHGQNDIGMHPREQNCIISGVGTRRLEMRSVEVVQLSNGRDAPDPSEDIGNVIDY